MVKIGLFVPMGSRGWIVSTTSPRTFPTFDLNKAAVQRAEYYGFDFALAMIKLRGFGGPSEYWDHNLEAFTLMAGLGAVTSKIKLYSSIALLTLPPALAARMTSTIDSIAPGRFGVNIVTGWQPSEYEQMGLWPGDEYFGRRYDYAAEYVTVMKQLWETGVSDFKGEFFQMNDCRLSPRPGTKIDIVAACSSDSGMRFVGEHCDYNFVGGGGGVNDVAKAGGNAQRLLDVTGDYGRDVKAYTLVMVVADRTDELAHQKWQYYREGTDFEALAWQKAQASRDKKASTASTGGQMAARTSAILDDPKKADPSGLLKIIGSYEKVAAMLDEIAEQPGIGGIMIAFDDFIPGVEQFGQHIQPLMKSRNFARYP